MSEIKALGKAMNNAVKRGQEMQSNTGEEGWTQKLTRPDIYMPRGLVEILMDTTVSQRAK